jgi:hypothetical protein
MLIIPERYKQNMKAPVKSMRARLVETTENGLSFNSGDDLISSKINAIGEFLGTGAKKITAVLIGEKTTLKDKTFKLELGMEDPATGEIDWCNDGEFVIKEVSVSVEKGTTEITGYDLMSVAQMTDYANSLLSFPCTIKNLIEQIANKLGLTVGNLDNLANINYTIKEDLYKKINGMNYRQIIDEIAKATGTTAVIRGKELIFKGFIEPTEKLNTSNMLSFKVGEDWGLPTKLVIGREPQGDNVLLEDKNIELEPAGTNLLDTPTEGTVSQNGYTAKINPNGSFTLTGKTEKGVDWCNYMTGRQNLSLPKGVYAFITDNPSPDVSNFLSFGMLAGGDKDFNIQKLQTGRLINVEWIVKNFYYFAGYIDKTKMIDYTTNLGLVKVNNKLLGTYEDLFDCEDTEVALDTYLDPWRDVAQQGMKLTKNEQTRRIVITGKPKTSWTLLQDNSTDKMNDILEDGAWYFFRNDSDRNLVACALSVYDKEANKTYYMGESQFFQVDKTKYKYRFYVETKNVNAWASANEDPKEFACSLHKLKHPIRYERFKPNDSETIKITNNEILDDDRQELITPLFNSLVKPKNIKMSEIEVSTEGHGIYEVGDVIKCEVGGQSYNLFINEIKLDITGGLKETLVCHVPKFTETNFLTAGGIVKTLYNTEIKTDKQQQEITAIVSKQEATDKDNQTQFTQLHQDIHNITQTVQTIGGGNLIKNSVGYGKDDSGKISEWTYDKDHTTITSSVSQNSVALGALSGYQLNLSNGDKMSQRIAVSSGQPHTISFKAFKKATGSGAITIKNDLGSKEILLKEQEELNWDEQVLTFTPTMSWIDVEIKANANSSISITDLMLAGGDSKQPWRQASGEIYNTQVSVDARGMQVRSSVYDGDYVEITPIEFVGYSSVSGKKKRVFSLNRDITEVEKLNARTQIQMPPMKIVPIDTDNYSGWAFVGLN